MRPRLLDLYCGAGGAGFGYSLAGFDVVGVDQAPQPRYPFAFVQADALEYLEQHGAAFDAIHASPPCQRYSTITVVQSSADAHPDLVAPTRELLRATGRPYIIENVMRAPLIDPVMLCGTMFGLGLEGRAELRRHRIFESDGWLWPPGPCAHLLPAIGVYGHAGGSSRRDPHLSFGSTADWRVAMGIDWMTGEELAEAIPPAYAEHLGQQLRSRL